MGHERKEHFGRVLLSFLSPEFSAATAAAPGTSGGIGGVSDIFDSNREEEDRVQDAATRSKMRCQVDDKMVVVVAAAIVSTGGYRWVF